MSAKREFQCGDLVFAHLKGHPHWPAKVLKLDKHPDCPPNRLPVWFFGSHNMGFILPKDLLPYEEFQQKFSTSKKIRGFSEALAEIAQENAKTKRSRKQAMPMKRRAPESSSVDETSEVDSGEKNEKLKRKKMSAVAEKATKASQSTKRESVVPQATTTASTAKAACRIDQLLVSQDDSAVKLKEDTARILDSDILPENDITAEIVNQLDNEIVPLPEEEERAIDFFTKFLSESNDSGREDTLDDGSSALVLVESQEHVDAAGTKSDTMVDKITEHPMAEATASSDASTSEENVQQSQTTLVMRDSTSTLKPVWNTGRSLRFLASLPSFESARFECFDVRPGSKQGSPAKGTELLASSSSTVSGGNLGMAVGIQPLVHDNVGDSHEDQSDLSDKVLASPGKESSASGESLSKRILKPKVLPDDYMILNVKRSRGSRSSAEREAKASKRRKQLKSSASARNEADSTRSEDARLSGVNIPDALSTPLAEPAPEAVAATSQLSPALITGKRFRKKKLLPNDFVTFSPKKHSSEYAAEQKPANMSPLAVAEETPSGLPSEELVSKCPDLEVEQTGRDVSANAEDIGDVPKLEIAETETTTEETDTENTAVQEDRAFDVTADESIGTIEDETKLVIAEAAPLPIDSFRKRFPFETKPKLKHARKLGGLKIKLKLSTNRRSEYRSEMVGQSSEGLSSSCDEKEAGVHGVKQPQVAKPKKTPAKSRKSRRSDDTAHDKLTVSSEDATYEVHVDVVESADHALVPPSSQTVTEQTGKTVATANHKPLLPNATSKVVTPTHTSASGSHSMQERDKGAKDVKGAVAARRPLNAYKLWAQLQQKRCSTPHEGPSLFSQWQNLTPQEKKNWKLMAAMHRRKLKQAEAEAEANAKAAAEAKSQAEAAVATGSAAGTNVVAEVEPKVEAKPETAAETAVSTQSAAVPSSSSAEPESTDLAPERLEALLSKFFNQDFNNWDELLKPPHYAELIEAKTRWWMAQARQPGRKRVRPKLVNKNATAPLSLPSEPLDVAVVYKLIGRSLEQLGSKLLKLEMENPAESLGTLDVLLDTLFVTIINTLAVLPVVPPFNKCLSAANVAKLVDKSAVFIPM